MLFAQSFYTLYFTHTSKEAPYVFLFVFVVLLCFFFHLFLYSLTLSVHVSYRSVNKNDRKKEYFLKEFVSPETHIHFNLTGGESATFQRESCSEENSGPVDRLQTSST
jgi:hypothetical protein